jgi:hypothetical protein
MAVISPWNAMEWRGATGRGRGGMTVATLSGREGTKTPIEPKGSHTRPNLHPQVGRTGRCPADDRGVREAPIGARHRLDGTRYNVGTLLYGEEVGHGDHDSFQPRIQP